MTKREASQLLFVIAAEIRVELDQTDEDCPSWADDIAEIAERLDEDTWRRA